MTDFYTSQEVSIRNAVQLTIDSFAGPIMEAGFIFDPAIIVIKKKDLSLRSSELVVYIRKGDQIVDALEFSVVEDGRETISASEAEVWVHTEISKLV